MSKFSGFSLTVIPFSWAIGRWDIRNKTVWAFGPLRFSIHRGLGGWKAEVAPRVGQRCVLRSGGSTMVVMRVLSNTVVRVVWLTDTGASTETFDTAMLRFAKD